MAVKTTHLQVQSTSSPSTSHCLYTLYTYTYPNIIYNLIQFGISFSSMLFVGRLENPKYLAAASLGNMLCNITGMSIGTGLLSALDTLCSTAYGSQQYQLVGLHTQRGLVIITITSVLVAVIWLQTYRILVYVGIDLDIAWLVHQWVTTLLYSLLPSLYTTCLTKYLNAQGIQWITVLSSLIGAVVNLICNVVNYEYLHYGFQGAVYSTVIANWVLFVTTSTCIYIRRLYNRRSRRRTLAQHQNYLPLAHDTHHMKRMEFGNPLSPSPSSPTSCNITAPVHSVSGYDEDVGIDTWPAWCWSDVMCGWYEWLRLGCASALSLFIEWGSFELIAFFANQLGTISLASHSILQQSCALFYMIPMSIAGAASTLVGHRLGSGDVNEVKQFIRLSFIAACIYGVINGWIFPILLRRYWAEIFTDDTDVLSQLYDVLPVLLVYGFFDSTKVVTMSVLRGCGRPQVTVWGNILATIVVMFPASYLLTFQLQLGLCGLWLGMSSAWATATIVYGFVIMSTDWLMEVELARIRNQNGSAPSMSLSDEEINSNACELVQHTDSVSVNTRDYSSTLLLDPSVGTLNTPHRRSSSPHRRSRLSEHEVLETRIA